MAFSSVLVFMHTSEERATAEQQEAGILADHIVTADPGLAPGAVRQAGGAPEVTAVVGLLKTSVLVPASGGVISAVSAQGVTGSARDLAAVQDLDVRSGRLSLKRGEIAVDASVADNANLNVGDRIPLRLPDGTRAEPRIVATYGRGLGLSQVTMNRAGLATHVTSAYDSELWTKGGTAAGLGVLGTVLDRADHSTAQSVERELNAWANAVMAAVLGGFAAVAAVNTLVMTVLDRRGELGTLRLIGSTRRQVLRMVRWEALLVALAGIALGTAIALATLIPMTKGLTGQGPYIPPLVYGAFAAHYLLARMSKLREKYPEMMMNAGMWKEYTTVYRPSRIRLSPLMGSQEWPTATRTIARYFALSKNASRCLAPGLAPAAARVGAGAPRWLCGVRGLGTPSAEDCAGGSGDRFWPCGRSGFVTGTSLRGRGTRRRGTSEAP
ncbi:hypothetical protein SALBM311S_04062 [Streptomyces alboniger]